ncbi:MAG: GAF domain-containing protein [bacterium]|nr:GAF domain-containing protein [bacterium]
METSQKQRDGSQPSLDSTHYDHHSIFQAVGVSIWKEDLSQVKAELDTLQQQGMQDLRRYFDENPAFVEHAISLVRIVDVNPATMRMFNAERKEDLLISLHPIFTPKTKIIFIEELIAIAERLPEFTGETTLQTLDGRVLDIVFTMAFPSSGRDYRDVLVTVTDVTRLKQAEKYTRTLQNLVALLSQSRTVEDIADIILTHGLREIGAQAGSVAVLLDDRATLQLIGSVGFQSHVTDHWHRFHIDMPNVSLAIAAKTQQPVWFSSYQHRLDQLPDTTATLVDTRFQAAAALPLIVQGRTIGAFGLTFTAERVFEEAERAFIISVAQHCAQAIDRAQVYEAEAKAHQEARKSADYVRRLQRVSTALAAALTIEQVGKIIVDQGIEVSNALTGSFQLLVDDDTAFASLYLAHSLMGEEERLKWAHYPASPLFPATEAAQTGKAMWFESSAEIAERFPVLAENAKTYPGATTLMPILVGGKAVGVINYVFSEKRAFPEEEKAFLLALTDQCAIALQRAQLYEAEQKARARAEKADRLKLQFLGMISHELRTPLTSIKGFASTLLSQDVEWEAESQQRFIQIINEEADKLTELIEQLLDLSRLEAGTLGISPYPQTVAAILQSAQPRLSALLTEHRLHAQLTDGLPLVKADIDRVGQVLVNLVQNAVRYSPPATDITIAVYPQDNAVQFDISDHGIGIPVEEREQVFQAFRQVERKLDKQKKGAGLGLAICKGLIEAHGGRIWIQDPPHPGTCISFTLPALS